MLHQSPGQPGLVSSRKKRFAGAVHLFSPSKVVAWSAVSGFEDARISNRRRRVMCRTSPKHCPGVFPTRRVDKSPKEPYPFVFDDFMVKWGTKV